MAVEPATPQRPSPDGAAQPVAVPDTPAMVATPTSDTSMKAPQPSSSSGLPQSQAKVGDGGGPKLQLPIAVVTHTDVGRLMQEIEAVDSFVRQALLQQQGEQVQLPSSSRLFDELISINKLDMHVEGDRRQLIQLLQVVRDKAPVLHMSFSTDPSPLFTNRLMTWLRQQIHPFVLLQVGLQPNIGAGCVLRTTNKYYDFSLKQRFTDTKPLLISKLRGRDEPVQPTEPAAKVATS